MAKIKHIDLEKTGSINELIKAYSGSAFNARKLAEATDIVEKMIKDKQCRVFLGVAGALVPAGMRKILVDMIRKGYVDVVVTTGANITHDLVEAIGECHEIGSEKADDRKLHKSRINRIYDVYMPNKVYECLEKEIKKTLGTMPKEKYSIKRFLYEFGKRVDDKDSLMRACADMNVPLFCPGLSDSGFGIQTMFHRNGIVIDALDDINEMISLTWGAKKSGAIILGGGVPKNFIFQALQFSKDAEYAVQITMDRPEHGGLSGATLEEAVSWGKIGEKAKHAEVICDVTIALPLMMAAVKERLG